ncbi:MAG: hypothetical protein RIQ79_2267 [Verrucomicrobiota bacterium]
MTFYRTGTIGLAVAMFALTGCAKGESAAGAPKTGAETPVATVAVKTVADYFPIHVGEKVVRVQIAATMPEMQRGLMGRAFIAADEGMVFLYEKPQRMSFWMRNTPTPLDIGFFQADGTLGEVYQMYPFDETPVSSQSEDYTLALEMNQGWFAKNELKPGVKLNLKELAAALRARGFKPEKFGVPAE